jgi:multidrug resistance efflux pump
MLRLPLYTFSGLVITAAFWAYMTQVDIAVDARGVVRPEGDVLQLVSETGGRILDVNAQEGSLVQAGDLLVQLDDRDLRLRERSLLDQIHRAEERLENVQRQVLEAESLDETAAEIDAAEEDAAVRAVLLNLEAAREQRRRTEQLFDEGLVSRQAMEQARLAFDRAKTERDRPSTMRYKRQQARAHIDELAAERMPIQMALATAYHDLQQCRLEITRRGVVAPMEGRITAMPRFKPGAFLNSGSLVASISPAGPSFVVEAYLPTADRAFVAVGQSVRLQFEAASSLVRRPIDGVVASIAPDATVAGSGAAGYRVIINPDVIPDASTNFQIGMTLRVHFIARQERLFWLFFERIQQVIEQDPV